MALKVNKEMLLKNRFWIMLGTSGALGFAGITCLEFVNADALRKGLQGQVNEARNVKSEDIKGPKALDVRVKEAATASAAESKVWSEAYAAQRTVFRWSDAVEKEFDFYDGKFATQIKVLKNADKGSWPADSDTVVHGVLLPGIKNSFLTIRARAKEKKNGKDMDIELIIRRTATDSITLEENNSSILWTEDLPKHVGKALAVTIQSGKYFNDLLRDKEQEAFGNSYRDQIHEILRSVEPLDERGHGIVELRDWLYSPDKDPPATKKFIRYVTAEWDVTGKMSDEAWIAQENIWIQKEIYRIIKSVNDDVKIFKRSDEKGDAEKRDSPQIFRNSNLEAQLVLKKDNSLALTIKNLLPRRQKLDMNFRVKLNKGKGLEPELIRVSGPALMPVGTTGKDVYEQTIPFAKGGKYAPREGIYHVEQVLSWEGAAIKRIDQVSIGSNGADDLSHSHRTYAALVPLEEKAAGKDEKDKKGGGPAAGPGVDGGGGDKKDGGKARGNEVGNRSMLAHGLWTHRYLEVSSQSRRVPVAVVLVVDQDHVDRVMTAFNNSKLRFLASQVLVNQHIDSLQPPSPDNKDDGGDKKGGLGKGPMGAGGGAKETVGGGDLETNMEMVIYGVMTLYHRHPPRAGADKK